MTVVLRALEPSDAEACDAIVRGLPYHFGQASGRAQAAAAVRTQRGLVAVDDGAVVGFCTFVRGSIPRPRSRGWRWTRTTAAKGSGTR